MRSPDEATYRAAVQSTVRRLLDLSDPLAPGPQVLPEMVAPWSLLQRAQSLLKGILWLLNGPSDAAVRIVARSLVDLTITVAWLRLDPRTHVRLWAAEQWRRELQLAPELEGRMGANEDEASLRVLKAKRSIVEHARTLALDRQVDGVGRRGPLVPDLKKRAEAVGDATRDAYALFFTPWSEWGHTGSGSLAVDSDGTTVSFDEGAPKDNVVVLSSVCALYAFVLAELSRWIGLGIEAECDGLREGLVRAEQQLLSGHR